MTASEGGALDFLHPVKPVGWKGLVPCAVLADRLGEQSECRVALELTRSERHVVARARVTNAGDAPVKLRALRWVADTSVTGASNVLQFPKGLEPFYFATENFRGDYIGTCTIEGDRYFKPMPTETVALGWSEDLVFPGVFVGSGTEAIGLFCAAASAERFHVMFRLRGSDGVSWGFEIEELPQGLEYIELAPGDTLEGEKLFFGIVETSDPQQATADYYAALERDGAFTRLAANPLPRERIWCSWNYSFMADVTEADVLCQLPVLKRHFPRVKFVQVDHGYERVYRCGKRAMIDFLYETDAPYDAAKFPGGPRKLVREIKAAGLRPATWIALWTSGSSDLVRDHPDWLLLDDTGRRLAYRPGHGVDGSERHVFFVLDVSVPAVRDYLERVCRTVFADWGFEGIKLDFFSFAFQCRRARFRHRTRTALEWLDWMVKLFRKYLPADGFLGLCSVAGTGSAVLGWGADYHRSGLDIGLGTWALVKRIAAWFANTNMLLARRPVLPNIDSIGWSDGFDEVSWRTWLSLCAVTGAALEVSGDLTTLDDARLTRLARTLEMSDPARRVWCLDVPHGKIEHPPAVWLAEGPTDRLIALFNWSDWGGVVQLGPIADVWPDWFDAFQLVWQDEPLRMVPREIDLPAHGSVLLRSTVRR
ncbi:MAG TPA: hypothetical protein VMY39_02480 [Planctomycetota bacterium]|nr:hypothetical protein [Planctomycetota bacterium]